MLGLKAVNCQSGDALAEEQVTAASKEKVLGADADAARVPALAVFKDFLILSKDADPEIPILKQAKVEYAKPQ